MTGRGLVAIEVLLLTLSALGGVGATDRGTEEPASGVSLEDGDGWRRLDVHLPGRLVSYALPRVKGGGRSIVFLVGPIEEQESVDPSPAEEDSDERKLPPCVEEPESAAPSLAVYRIDSPDSHELTLLSDRIPGDVTAIDVADLEGDGVDELMLAGEGQLFLFDPGDAPGPTEIVSVLREPELRWHSLHPRAVRTPELDGWPVVRTHHFGELRLHGPADGGDSWTVLGRVDIPFEARVFSRGLRIHGSVPRFIGRRGDGTLLFGTPAENHGKQRVHTKLIEISASGEARITESWSRLPTPETILERHFIMMDGRPLLLVTTKTSEKLSLFGEKLLRLFPVERNLSRLGRNPLLATATNMNLWQEVTPIVADVNADGRTDLVLGYWKGLKDDRVVLDAHLRLEDGSFRDKPYTTAFNVKNGDRSFVEFGTDLDGDTHADLLLRNESGELLLFPSLPSTNGKKLVSSTPRELSFGDDLESGAATTVVISVGGAPPAREISGGQPRLVDLDGDDRMEILLVHAGGAGQPGAFRVLWLDY